MDIIIPYIRSDFPELRYALRSICKFQPHDQIVLTGDLPDWYNGLHLPCEMVLGRPEFDVTKKILTAAQHATDDFILWQDDIFKLSDAPVRPVYCDTLEHALKKRSAGRFKNIMLNTYAVFPDGFYYGGHTPMIMNGEKLREGVERLWQKDMIPKTFYGNYAEVGGVKTPDCKLTGAYRYDDIQKLIAGKEYLSTGHTSFNRDMLRALNELFPEKCKYEK